MLDSMWRKSGDTEVADSLNTDEDNEVDTDEIAVPFVELLFPNVTYVEEEGLDDEAERTRYRNDPPNSEERHLNSRSKKFQKHTFQAKLQIN